MNRAVGALSRWKRRIESRASAGGQGAPRRKASQPKTLTNARRAFDDAVPMLPPLDLRQMPVQKGSQLMVRNLPDLICPTWSAPVRHCTSSPRPPARGHQHNIPIVKPSASKATTQCNRRRKLPRASAEIGATLGASARDVERARPKTRSKNRPQRQRPGIATTKPNPKRGDPEASDENADIPPGFPRPPRLTAQSRSDRSPSSNSL
jgi:hypothetical protein